jgi:hypothetical protein
MPIPDAEIIARVKQRWYELADRHENNLGYGEFDIEVGTITATAMVHAGKIQFIQISDSSEKVRRKIRVNLV